MKYSAEPEDWWDVTAPIGEERRFNHGDRCKDFGERSGDFRGRLFVRRTNTGWKYNCFNCGFAGTRPYAANDLGRISKYCNLPAEQVPVHSISDERPCDPSGYDQKLHPKALEWLYKYEIEDWEIDEYGLRYDYRRDLLVLPITNRKGEVRGWQGRNFQESTGKYQAKYLTFVPPGESLRFRVYKEEGPICIVEDVLSAIKVGRHVNCMALLGSPNQLPFDVCEELEDTTNEVIVWLDPDKKHTSIKYVNKLSSLFDVSVRAIFSDKDPKDYSDEEIQKCLEFQ